MRPDAPEAGLPEGQRDQKRIALGLTYGIAFAWLAGIFGSAGFSAWRSLTSLGYIGLAVWWAQTVQERILDGRTRRFLVLGAAFLVLLFVLRICRWDLFAASPVADEFLWYAYYPVFLIVPAASFCAALRIGEGEETPLPRAAALVWAAAAGLCAAVMTNRLHRGLFEIHWQTGRLIAYDYGPVYYLVIVWYLCLTVATLAVLIARCRLSASRQRWVVPASAAAASVALMAVYYAAGGAPAIAGVKLYNIQEIHLLLFVGVWECAFQIGLVPTNTGYSELFSFSTLGGVIVNAGGEIVYRSGIPESEMPVLQISSEDVKNRPPEEALTGNASPAGFGRKGQNTEMPGMADDKDQPDVRRYRSADIRGGRIYWAEDLTEIRRLEGSLREALEQIQSENTLLSLENETREQQAQIEARSRIYDGVSALIQPQAQRLKGLLSEGSAGEIRAIWRIGWLGAYIKRRANLVLIAEGTRRAPVSELYFAIRESMDYLSLGGMTCDVRQSGERDADVSELAALYECFEQAAEQAAESTAPMMVHLACVDGLEMSLITNIPLSVFRDDFKQKTTDSGSIHCRVVREDGTTYLSFVCIGEEVSP